MNQDFLKNIESKYIDFSHLLDSIIELSNKLNRTG